MREASSEIVSLAFRQHSTSSARPLTYLSLSLLRKVLVIDDRVSYIAPPARMAILFSSILYNVSLEATPLLDNKHLTMQSSAFLRVSLLKVTHKSPLSYKVASIPDLILEFNCILLNTSLVP